MKWKTVRQGEQVVIFNHLGEGRLVVGPQRVFLYRERLQTLRHYSATLYQYLQVTDNTGLVTHKPGPCEMFCNPLEHQRIEVQCGVQIDANHLIVVYKQGKAGNVERRIVQGPTLFIPQAEEWLHEFKWHGSDWSSLGRMVPGKRVFKQLAVVPDHFYYNVRDVRTTDDTMLSVKLMIFYQLKDIVQMLEATHDPIADMINAVCADVIAFAASATFQQFLAKSSQLSDLSSFPHLAQRAQRVGYTVSKVVYRGYHASDQLQSMQDSAITSRTELRLNSELQQQTQRLTDFKLQREQRRTQTKQQIERSQADHRQQIQALTQTHQLSQKQKDHQTELLCSDMMARAKMDCDTDFKQQEVDFLQRLRSLNIDLTQFLINQQAAPVDQEVQVVGSRPRQAWPDSGSPGNKNHGNNNNNNNRNMQLGTQL